MLVPIEKEGEKVTAKEGVGVVAYSTNYDIKKQTRNCLAVGTNAMQQCSFNSIHNNGVFFNH